MSDISVENHEVDTDTIVVNEQSETRKGASGETLKKVRAVITETENGPLTTLQTKLKDRGLKNFDIGEVIAEALSTIDSEWWEKKLEVLTPIEFKLQAALENPEMRAKLESLPLNKNYNSRLNNRSAFFIDGSHIFIHLRY